MAEHAFQTSWTKDDTARCQLTHCTSHSEINCLAWVRHVDVDVTFKRSLHPQVHVTQCMNSRIQRSTARLMPQNNFESSNCIIHCIQKTMNNMHRGSDLSQLQPAVPRSPQGRSLRDPAENSRHVATISVLHRIASQRQPTC